MIEANPVEQETDGQRQLDEAKGYEAERGATFHRQRPQRNRRESMWPIRDADTALVIWAEYAAASGEPTLVRPKGLDRTSKPLDGLAPAETQLAKFVEETEGFVQASSALWTCYVDALSWESLHKATRRTVLRFQDRLQERLPWAPETAVEVACGADLPTEREAFPPKRSLRDKEGMGRAA